MVSSRKKRQSKRKLISQLDDFDRDFIIGNTVSNQREIATVNEVTGDQDFTVGNSGSRLAANEILVIVRTLERCFNERIDMEMGNFVDTVKDRI